MFCQKSYKVSKSKIEIKNQDGKTSISHAVE